VALVEMDRIVKEQRQVATITFKNSADDKKYVERF
jgi:hypothetical protein